MAGFQLVTMTQQAHFSNRNVACLTHTVTVAYLVLTGGYCPLCPKLQYHVQTSMAKVHL